MDQADALEGVQRARLARNVGGRETLPEIRVIGRVARFGDHVAVAILVELDHHHPAVAGYGTDVVGGDLAHRFEGDGIVELEQEVADLAVQVAEVGRGGAVDLLEFEHQQAVVAVRQHIEIVLRANGQGAQVGRALGQRGRLQFPQDGGAGRRAEHVGERLADGLGVHAGQRGQVVAGLEDGEVVVERQKKAVRLDAAWRANRFLVTARQVQLGAVGQGLGHGMGALVAGWGQQFSKGRLYCKPSLSECSLRTNARRTFTLPAPRAAAFPARSERAICPGRGRFSGAARPGLPARSGYPAAPVAFPGAGAGRALPAVCLFPGGKSSSHRRA